jgi:hypothetical protein
LSNKGPEFLDKWFAENITPGVKLSTHGDAGSMSVEMAERLVADAARARIALDDLEPEFCAPEVLIREALVCDEGTPCD